MNMQNPVTERKTSLAARFAAIQARKLDIDMTRGKPCVEQVSLSQPMQRLSVFMSRDGIDCRNYGHLEGLPEARELCARYLGTEARYTYIADGSSLSLMHDFVLQGLVRGLPGWKAGDIKPSILCPAPGYDRHHTICETYGIKMVPIPMTPQGPDLAHVLDAVKNPSVVAMFCVPKYHNPTGVTWSDATVETLATMRTACHGFRLIWDNAYAVHDLYERSEKLLPITRLVRGTSTEDRPVVFGSFSKVTFAGAGLAFMGMSEQNFAWWRKGIFAQTIGGNKLNQLRHVRFLGGIPGIRAHMRRHARIVRPKFEMVENILARELKGKGIAHCDSPRGGYFISFYLEHGSAKRTVELAKELGVKFTPAGAAFPYGKDPFDSHIRIAPTFPSMKDLAIASEVLALCAEMSHWERWPQERVSQEAA